ncbi:hypothetical protein [Mediterraneibacter gnavus]|uniref:hypothetical protein n=1 Tax=Mediterraneibacter gnavus TaxID=33038 RepID=UPI002286A9F1|nr:hypothetical protein [Mediterraneibacter gnavus]MCZ0658343.1 hypothetical protein [Mediterraneibacter gnavus]
MRTYDLKTGKKKIRWGRFCLIAVLLYIAACKLRSNGMPVPLLRNCYSIFNGTKYR